MPDQSSVGPLLPHQRLLTLRDAAVRVADGDRTRLAQTERVLDGLVLPLTILADIAQESLDALSGSSSAVDRLTTALALVGSRRPTVGGVDAIVELDWRERVDGAPEMGSVGRDLVDLDEIGLIGLGAAYAAVARPEAAELIDRGMRVALNDLMALDVLWALTPSILEDDPKSMRLFGSVIDWLDQRLRPIGPPDPSLPDIPDVLKKIPFDRRQLLDRVRCVLRSYDRLKMLPLGAPYVIASIVPNVACPGQKIVVTGSGFGAQEQIVRFPTIGGTAAGLVSNWSDTSIEVVVPADATCGDIQLLIPAGATTTCTGQSVDVMKPGSGNLRFAGGIADIRAYTVNGKATRVRVEPGGSLEFVWQACPSTATVDVKVREVQSGWSQTSSGFGATGRWTWTVPKYASAMTVECTLEVTSTCTPTPTRAVITADVAPLPNVKIEGIEVTQGIQTFWRTGVTDNMVSTVAGKDTIVRVYVSADVGAFNSGQVPNIWGTLSVGSTNLSPIGASPFFTARKRSDINRETINHTLNFRIPAGMANGTKGLFAYLIVPGPNGTVDQIVSKLLNWTWVVEPAIKVRYVRIRDESDPANVIDAPTDAACRATSFRAIDMLPFPADVAAAFFPNLTTSRDFTVDADGAALATDIGNLRSAAETLRSAGGVLPDTQERWMGLTTRWFRAWGGWNSCVAPVSNATSGGERLRAAHELGHTLGLCHMHDSACFTAAGLTAEPTLDDTALDLFHYRTIAGTGHDFMSYTTWNDNWTSKVNWEAMRALL